MNKKMTIALMIFFVLVIPLFAKKREAFQVVNELKGAVAPSREWSKNLTQLNQTLLAHNYKKSFELIGSWKKNQGKYGVWIVPVLESIALLAKHDDLGRKVDKLDAKKILISFAKKCERVPIAKNKDFNEFRNFWCAWAGLQEGMVVGWSGLFKVRSSAKKLSEMKLLSDAKGLSAIYGYYSSTAFSNIGFGDNGKSDREILEKAFMQTKYFKSILGLALGWVYYGEKKFDRTELLSKKILLAEPENRVFRQMLGDAYKSQNFWQKARVEYLKSESEYKKVALGSVRHVSALGNLILISKALGSKDLSTWKKEYLKYIDRVEDEIPLSLIEELDAVNAFDS
jgi:hypothetical protein